MDIDGQMRDICNRSILKKKDFRNYKSNKF